MAYNRFNSNNPTETVGFKLREEERAALDAARKVGEVRSRTAFLRDCIGCYLEHHPEHAAAADNAEMASIRAQRKRRGEI